jgi:hypothetical protein
MHRNLLLGAAAIALAAAANSAQAQVAPGDVVLEGPMSDVKTWPAYDEAVMTPTGAVTRKTIGELKVLGVSVKVLEGALIHTPTNADGKLTLDAFAEQALPLPGRTQGGFIGGTAIITGESIGGQVFASDVFSDLFEHVVVGEATGIQKDAAGVRAMTINGMKIARIPATETRMPAAPPINGFGLRIKPNSIVKGTLVAAEGYLAGDTLYYHALEADSADLVNPTATQVGILRADCRVRGGGRDEIEVRGGVANPADATVQIRIPDPTPANLNRFTTIGVVTAIPDTTTGNPQTGQPQQGLFRADFRNLTLPGGVCPTRVRAVVLGGTGSPSTATATADMAGR